MKTWKTIAVAATIIVAVALVIASAAAYVGGNATNKPSSTVNNGASYPYRGMMGYGANNQYVSPYPQNYGRCNGTAIYPYQNSGGGAFGAGCCGCR